MKRRTRRRRLVLLAVAGVPFAFVVILVLYLAFGDLGRHRGVVEDLVTDVLGRRLRIAGRFEPRLLSLTPSVIAEDVSLANPDWSAEPFMVHADRLEASIVLGSIFSGPIRIKDLRVEGAQVRLEVDGTGQASWDFDIKPSDKQRSPDEVPRPPIIFEDAHLQNVDFSFRNLSTERGIELDLGSARLDPEESDNYRVTIDGHVNGTSFDLAGNYGPVDWFIVFKRAEYQLQGRLARIDFTIAGQMANLRRLEDSDSTVELQGPEVADLTETFGLPSLGTGPFALTATTVPEEDGTDVDVEATLGEVDASVHGHVASLTSIDELDLEIEGGGPNLQAFGALFGAGQLPPASFLVSGRLQRSGGTTVFDGVEAHLGDDRLSVDGRIGKPPTLVGTDVNVTASGDDLSELSSLVNVRLPGGAYQVRGRVVRDEAALELHDVRLTLEKNDLHADGKLTDPPRFEGSDLIVQASGPDLSAFSSFAGVELPSRSFEVEGRVKGGDERFEFEAVHAKLGQTGLRLDGGAPKLTELDGVDVVIHVEGPDLGEVLSLAGLDDLPTEMFEVEGRVRVAGKRFRLTDVAATVGDMTASLDGTIAGADGFVGTDVAVAASGSDLSRLGAYAAYDRLPNDPYRVEGQLRVEREGFRLDGVEVGVGDLSASADGLVGNGSALDGSDLEFEVRGPRLTELARFGDLPELPSLPFSVAGRVRVDEGAFRLEPVHGSVGANRVTVEGWLGPFPDLERTDISVKANGPDLDDVATAVETAAGIDLPDLPEQEFGVSGEVRVVGGRYELTDVETRLGDARLSGHGWVGALPDLFGTDVTVHASGPQASLIAAIAGISLPEEPFRIDGRVEWTEGGGRFHDVRASVGSYALRADGTLGKLPKLVGTVLDVHASGPEPSLIGQFVDLPRLPAKPFEVAAHFEGTPEEFTLQGLRATLGESDLAGDLRVDLRDKPVIHARLTSRRIDLAPLLPQVPEDEVEEQDRNAESEEPAPDRDKKRRVIPETPFDFKVLNDQDAEIHLSIDTLTSRQSTITDFELQLNLADGRLRVDPLSAVGEFGAVLTASLDLAPTDGAYRLESYLDLQGARIDLLSYGEDAQQWPPIDIRLDLSGEGRSPRELAASLDGYAALDVGAGLLDPSIMDLLVFDVLVQMLELLNPFRKDEKFTEMECAVIVARVEDGRVVLDPLAVQTNKMTVVGQGKINLHNEKLDLDWTSKPRKGIGASASLITNPYIKIGGTLADPNLEMKPLHAATATGAAVATVGLSLVAKGLWDRVTAEKKICKRVRKRVNEIKDEIQASGGE